MPQIRAVVVNHSQYNLKDVAEILLWHKSISLTGWVALRLRGKDCSTWLQRQLTQDVRELPSVGRSVARLDRAGHVNFYGVLLPAEDNSFDLVLPEELVEAFKSDLEKFVIMEEVFLDEKIQKSLVFYGDHQKGHSIDFFGQLGSISIDSTHKVDLELYELFCASCGIPRFGVDFNATALVNETRLNELAVNYNKGCFLGQETAAKIQSRRGANNYPVLLRGTSQCPSLGELKLGDEKIGQITSILEQTPNRWIANAILKRQWRVLGAKHDFGTIENFPFYDFSTNAKKAHFLYLEGVKDFEQNNEELALKKLTRATYFDPNFADAYEAIGVIHSRRGEHAKTIEWMDELLKVNPQSVMAHTNKSLAYMNLGEIEKAEEEKSQATFKSFAIFGNEAKQKKEQQAAKEQELSELARREEMFNQVLAIDESDLIALFGLGDIAFKKEEYQRSLEYILKARASHPKHSQSILLHGKCLEKLGKSNEAREVYREGIKTASAQGELMPANEMQARLNSL